ncbi:ribonuclease P protein component [Breoghania sp. JC706]|uniref:ribonuclease P protein component n=1 Tax=Breoghania sp. JC706 TaxID=3117732 RepID=UPI0030087624
MPVLKKRSEFLAVAKGVRAPRRAFVLQALCDSDSGHMPRIGYTVTKKTGNSVERNRIKRRLRAAIREVAPFAARPACDYVLIGRRAALDISFSDLKKDLAAGFARVHKDARSPVDGQDHPQRDHRALRRRDKPNTAPRAKSE